MLQRAGPGLSPDLRRQIGGEFKSLVGDYTGTIVCDAAATHIAGARGEESLTLAGCWAHVYRRFEEAGDDFPTALIVRGWIQDVYRIDARAVSTDDRARLRATESARVLDKMKTWMHEQRVLATTSLGGAIRYTLKNWDRLTVFVRDPLVWLDNNRTERGLRGPVVGRKNWLFVGSDDGGEVNATFVSLLASCGLHKIEPFAYIRDLLCLLPGWPSHRVLELAPAYWSETLEKRKAQEALDANVLRRVVLGLQGGAAHRPPELPREAAAVCDG